MATFYRPYSNAIYPFSDAATPIGRQYGYQAATHLDAALKRSHEVQLAQLLAELRNADGTNVDICSIVATDLIDWFYMPAHATLRSVTFESCATPGWSTPLLMSLVRESAPAVVLTSSETIVTSKPFVGALTEAIGVGGPVSNIGSIPAGIERQTVTHIMPPTHFGLSDRLMLRIDQLPTPTGSTVPTLCPPTSPCCNTPSLPKIKLRMTFEVY